MAGGDSSAMYMGATIRDAPTPSPPIMRAMTSISKLGARAEETAETAYRMAA